MYKDHDDKLLEELRTEKTAFSDQIALDAGAIKTTVRKIDSSKPNETIKTVHETGAEQSDESQKTRLDNKLVTERIVEKPNAIGDTTKFLEQEIFDSSILDEGGLHTDAHLSRKTITATKDFLQGESDSQNEFITISSDYIVEEARDSDAYGDGTTIITTTQEFTDYEIVQPDTSNSADKTDTNNVHFDIHVSSRDVFNQDTDSDEFYKTIEEKITKKMSQDFSINKNDITTEGKLIDLSCI